MTNLSSTIQASPVVGYSPVLNTAKPVFRFHVKDPGSALTHLIGFAASIFATPILLIQASIHGASLPGLVSLSVFMLSMILLYGASTTYHSFDISEKANRILRKIDHMMIFLLIAGSYTPVCVIGLDGMSGLRLLILVWGIALIGLILKACWITCPKWFSSVIYIGMGWVCLLALPELLTSLPASGFAWLLAGGIVYTVGGVIYALKLPLWNARFKNFGSHELFHVFVMGGSFCHFIFMYQYLAVM